MTVPCSEPLLCRYLPESACDRARVETDQAPSGGEEVTRAYDSLVSGDHILRMRFYSMWFWATEGA